MTVAREIGVVIGTAVFGPGGALIGGIAGAAVDAVAPLLGDIGKGVVSNLAADYVGGAIMHRELGEQNHDLQRAFRAAAVLAVTDIGGRECFPRSKPAAIDDGVAYLSSKRGTSTVQEKQAWQDRICALLHGVVQGIDKGTILPLTPLQEQPQLLAQDFLLNETSEAFAGLFYRSVFSSVVSAYVEMFASLTDLERHLKWQLFERTHFHFGELLKSDEHSKAWIAFQRALLQGTQAAVKESQAGHAEIMAALEEIRQSLDSPERLAQWQNVTADLLAVHDLEKAADVSLSAVVDRLVDAHQRQLDALKDSLTHTIQEEHKKTRAIVEKEMARLRGDLLVEGVPIGDAASQRLRKDILDYIDKVISLHTFSLQWRVQATMRSPKFDSVYVPQRMVRVQEDLGSGTLTPDPPGTESHVDPLPALLQARTLVVLGEPGSGKSVLLHYLALELARDCQRRFNSGLTGGYLPVLVPLGGFLGDRGWRSKSSSVSDLLAHIDRALHAMTTSLDWRALMAERRIALLFDAFDEVTFDSRQELIDGMQRLATGIGAGCPIILTSRETSYQQSPQVLGAPFQVYRLELLQPLDVKPAVAAWISALSGLDSRDAKKTEQRAQALVQEIDLQPGLRAALRNPLRLWLTVRSYLAQQKLVRLGSLYDQYVDDALASRKDSPQHEAAWPDTEHAKACLQTLAWRMHSDGDIADVAQAERVLMQDCGLTEPTVRPFVRAMHEDAGLLVLREAAGANLQPGQVGVGFGPHQSFYDFFVGRYLADWWRRDRGGMQAFVRSKHESVDWRPAIRFALSLLADDETEARRVFDFILEELARHPLWGVWCLKDGLELDAGSLPQAQRQRIYRQMSRQARHLLRPPGRFGQMMLGVRHRSEEKLQQQFMDELTTVQALAKLQLPESGHDILHAMYRIAFAGDEEFLAPALRTPLVDLDHRGLWPAIMDALDAGIEWVRSSAAFIITEWRDPAALEAMQWLLNNTEFTRWAIQGIAGLGAEESEAEFQRLLDDPLYGQTALEVGLYNKRGDVIDRGLSALQMGNLGSLETQRLLEAIVELPLDQATIKMATALPLIKSERDRWQWFKVTRERQLPTLRVLVPLLQHDDPEVVSIAQEVIPAVTLGGDLDPRDQDTQVLLEQILLYGNDEDRRLPEMAAQQLGSTRLSADACRVMLQQLDDPETSVNVIRFLHRGPSIPEPYRRRMAQRIQAEFTQDRFARPYLVEVLAHLGVQAAAQEMASTTLPDDAPVFDRRELALKLVRLRSKDAYPLVMDLFRTDEQWQSDGAIALVQLASVLSPSQRREAAEQIKPLLRSSPWPDRWTVVYALGKLRARAMFTDILDSLQDNVPSVQQIIAGLALSEMGSYRDTADDLERAFAGREGRACGAVIYAWGASAASQAVNPLARALLLPDDYLRSADSGDYHGDLAWASRDLRARAAFCLGWLAAVQGAADPLNEARIVAGWRSLLGELSPDHPLARGGVAALLAEALNKHAPARSIYNASSSRGEGDQRLLAALLGAFEWSQVLLHMVEHDRFQSLHTWEILRELLSPSSASANIEKLQTELAALIAWQLPDVPFKYLMSYVNQRSIAAREPVAPSFWREVDNWHDWTVWRRRLVLPEY
jgi:HEAT repeat protein